MKHFYLNNTIKFYLMSALLLTLSYFAIFQDLGSVHIQMWDEATYANNSIDMLMNDNWITVMHENEPDLYNTKPPLIIWLQALSMSIFGINEFSVRFPSAMFGLLTVISIFVFSLKVLKNNFIGLSSAIILLSSSGFMGHHVVITGDLDSSLVFWLTFYSLIFLTTLFYKKYENNLAYLLISAGICFSFLTKGVAGFLFLPSLFIISLLFNNRRLYAGYRVYYYMFLTLFICCSYYYIREIDSPGYFKIVWENEILRINNIVMDWQVKPFNYYLKNLIETRFYPYFIFLPLSILTFLFHDRNSKLLKTTIYLFTIAVGYFLIISYPPVKLEWYDAPLLPILSLIVAINLHVVIKLFKINSLWVKFLVVIVLLTNTSNSVLSNNLSAKDVYIMERDGLFLKEIVKKYPNIQKLTVFKVENHSEHYDQVLFYKRAFLLEKGIDIVIKQIPQFIVGEYILVCKDELQTLLLKEFVTEVVFQNKIGVLHKIIKKV